ncbi:hypothetical protein Hdeb2414_s0211g00834161 [Helianthus debilis subsp. tardiflorus]
MCFANSQSVCECFGQNALKNSLYLSGVCIYPLTYTAWVYIYPAQHVWSEGSDRWSEGSSIEYIAFEGSQGPRRMIFRGLSIEAYLSV